MAELLLSMESSTWPISWFCFCRFAICSVIAAEICESFAILPCNLASSSRICWFFWFKSVTESSPPPTDVFTCVTFDSRFPSLIDAVIYASFKNRSPLVRLPENTDEKSETALRLSPSRSVLWSRVSDTDAADFFSFSNEDRVSRINTSELPTVSRKWSSTFW